VDSKTCVNPWCRFSMLTSVPLQIKEHMRNLIVWNNIVTLHQRNERTTKTFWLSHMIAWMRSKLLGCDKWTHWWLLRFDKSICSRTYSFVKEPGRSDSSEVTKECLDDLFIVFVWWYINHLSSMYTFYHKQDVTSLEHQKPNIYNKTA
jgi:hypothetical protein